MFAGVVRATGFTTGHDSVYKGHPTAQTYIKTITLNTATRSCSIAKWVNTSYADKPTLAQVDAYLHNNIPG